MFGLLNVNKPAGVTSRDVVNHVQRLARPHKAGHAGTLDPLADGVLVLALGQATRLVPYVQHASKRYLATFLLGRESDTEDVDGQVVEVPDARQPSLSEIEAALQRFVGEIDQQPPVFSALKVGGERAYRLARAGKQVALEKRRVVIHELEVLEYAYPELRIDVACGSGVYIRSLGRDLARAVGSAAVMSQLTRTAIGPFLLNEAVSMMDLTAETLPTRLLPGDLAVTHLPRLEVSPEEAKRLANGQFIHDRWRIDGDEAAAFDESGSLLAIVRKKDDLANWRPLRNFHQ